MLAVGGDVVNRQRIIPHELRDAIIRHTTRRRLLRMKEESRAKRGYGGPPPKPAFCHVGRGGPNDLALRRMSLISALAESGFGDGAVTTVPSARTYPPDDIVMALPVEVSEVPDEYSEYLRNLAPRRHAAAMRLLPKSSRAFVLRQVP